MRLIIDAREAFAPQKTGKGVYAYSVISTLYNELSSCPVVLLTDRKVKLNLPSNWQQKILKGGSILWQIKAALFVRSQKNSLLFSPTSYLLPYLAGGKSLVVVHDLISFFYPAGHNRKALIIERFCLPKLVNHSKFLAVSNSTKRDMVRLFPKLKAKNIFVAEAALSSEFSNSPRVKYKKNNGQILSVSSLIPRKNLVFLVKAFDQLVSASPDYKNCTLHIVGAESWKNPLLASARGEIVNSGNFIFHGYLSHEKLQKLYQESAVFVFPSLYEGFGLPLLEAMASRCAIICSSVSSLPEVAGAAAVYFDPTSLNDLVNQLGYLLKNRELQNVLAEEGLKRLKNFSWSKTVKVIKSLLP